MSTTQSVECPICESEDFPYSWAEAGVHYGFPECCIAAFYARMFQIEMAEALGEPEVDLADAGSPFYLSGYVPCSECAARPVEEIIAEINVDRACPTPFALSDKREDS